MKWPFQKPKGPGYGISKGFFLTVLATAETMPSIFEIVNPKGEQGAIDGYGVPLGNETGFEVLHRPLQPGGFAVATREQKTVLRLITAERSQANYNPEPYLQTPEGRSRPDLLQARMRAVRLILQLTFETYDPEVFPALDFFMAIAERATRLSDGVLADAVSRRYLLPDEVQNIPRADPRIDARDFVAIQTRTRADGMAVCTLGLQKFGIPELEILHLVVGDVEQAGRLLMALAQSQLVDRRLEEGERFGSPDAPFTARPGGFDPDVWQGVPVLELSPPLGTSEGAAVQAWAQAMGRLRA